jgi:hypothetical protein
MQAGRCWKVAFASLTRRMHAVMMQHVLVHVGTCVRACMQARCRVVVTDKEEVMPAVQEIDRAGTLLTNHGKFQYIYLYHLDPYVQHHFNIILCLIF